MYFFEKTASSLSDTQNILDTIYNENPSHWPNGLTSEHFDGGLYMVRKEASNQPVGFVGWQERREGFDKVGYYSIGILPEYRRNGFAKQAVTQLLEKKASEVDIVKALVMSDNKPSLSLAEKLDNVVMDVKQAAGRCWSGYEPVPGKPAYSDGSCRPARSKKKKKKSLKKSAEVKQEGDGYCVYSKGGKKMGGPYATEDEAKNRQRQVDMFKHMPKRADAEEKIARRRYRKRRPKKQKEDPLLEAPGTIDDWESVKNVKRKKRTKNIDFGDKWAGAKEEKPLSTRTKDLQTKLDRLVDRYSKPAPWYYFGLGPDSVPGVDILGQKMDEDYFKRRGKHKGGLLIRTNGPDHFGNYPHIIDDPYGTMYPPNFGQTDEEEKKATSWGAWGRSK